MPINIKKTAISITIMIIMVAPLFFYAGYFIKQQQLQSKMVAKLKQSMLCTISVKQEEAKWVKSNKEILVNGRLFDIKSIIKKGDLFVFKGLFDVDEDLLQKAIEDFHNRKNNEDSPIEQLIVKYLSSVAIHGNCEFLMIGFTICLPCPYSRYVQNASQQYLSIISPPPKV